MTKFIIFISFITTLNSLGQIIHFKNYSAENGLSNNSVNRIINDENGALWIATWDGLNYFDGHSFKIYKHNANDTTSVAGNEIKRIIKDPNNNIWVLTNESVSRYIGNNKFKNYFYKGGDLFLNTNNQVSVTISKDSTLTFDGKKFNLSKTKKKEKNKHLIFKNLLLSKFPNLIINDILIDNNVIYFATRFNGLFTLKINQGEHKFTQYTKESLNNKGFKSNEIEKIHKDIFGGIWLAFKDGGISLLQHHMEGINEIFPSDSSNDLPSETIRAITKDTKNNIWIGYYNKGIYQYNKRQQLFIPVKIKESVSNPDWNRIRSLYTDSKGNVWAGTYAGIIKISNNKIQLLSSEKNKNFPNNRIYSFYEENNHLWVGCWGGVAKININTSSFEAFPYQEKLNSLHVRNIIKSNNKLIIGTENESLVTLNLSNGNLKTLKKENGIISNSVFSLLETNNNLWIATLGGISVIDNNLNLIKNITEKEGLTSHMVYGLLQIEDEVWANTTKGISKINTSSFEVKNINLKYCQEQEFSEGAYYKDNNNNLYYGGVKGLVCIKPNSLNLKPNIPKLNLTIDGIKSTKTEKEYHKNYFKATISAISFENSSNVILYKLSNYDKKWRTLNNENTIFYKDLPSGKYTFMVKNSLDPKSVISHKIIINKPFYFSNWFLTLCIGAIALSFISFLYLKNKSSLKFQNNLQKEVEKRTETIEKQKEELSIIHNQLKNNNFEVEQFKNYITSQIKQPLNIALAHIPDINIYPEKKELIYSEIRNLLNTITEWDYLNDASKLIDYEKKITSCKSLIDYITTYQKDLTLKEVKFNFKHKVDPEYIEIDIIRHKLMIQYIMNILLSYAQPSRLDIDVTIKKERFLLTCITDNKLLIENIEEIKKYNSYYKAFNDLVYSLDGKSEVIIEQKTLEFTIDINVNYPNITIEPDYFKKNSNFKEIPKDKKVILVYSAIENFNAAETLLENSEYHIVFEENIKDVSKYLSKTKIFDLVVFYNIPFSSELIKLSNFIAQSAVLSTLYISEKIDYTIQELVELYHIDDVIQLPVSKKFIINKVSLLTGLKKPTTKTPQKKIKPEYQKIIDQAIEIINKKHHEIGFNVEILTESLQISRIKCYRVFKEVLHQTPSDYINQFRMEKSLELLKEQTLNISEIAFECGFNDPKYFSKAFKKYYGKSPKNIL